MRIEPFDGLYVICRGDENHPSYFSFYVDADSSSWTAHRSLARHFGSEAEAEEGIAKLRQRDKMRREARQRRRVDGE